MPTEQKIAWLDAEHAAGVREIEVSSFVPPKLLPQLADAEAVVRHALSLPGLTVSALIPNLKGAERGLAQFKEEFGVTTKKEAAMLSIRNKFIRGSMAVVAVIIIATGSLTKDAQPQSGHPH